MKSLIKRLIEAYKERNLPNFFVPSQNLLEDEKDVQLITISLKKVLSCVNEIETFLSNIRQLNVSDYKVTDLSPELKTSINKEKSIEDIIFMFLSQFNSELISCCTPIFSGTQWDGGKPSIEIIINIKRIIRLIVLHQENSATTSSKVTSDEHIGVFSEILNFSIESAAKYFEVYKSILPKELPITKHEVKMTIEGKLFSHMDKNGTNNSNLMQNHSEKGENLHIVAFPCSLNNVCVFSSWL